MNFDQIFGICYTQGFNYWKHFDIEPHIISITLVHPVLVPQHMPATFYSAIFRVQMEASSDINFVKINMKWAEAFDFYIYRTNWIVWSVRRIVQTGRLVILLIP